METLTLDGRMKDLSGNGNHGTMTGTADVPGKIGRARHFGGGDRITALSIPVPSANFTIAAWFNWTTNPTPYYSGIQGGGGSWELRVMADGRFGATFYQSIGPDIFTDIRSPLAYNDGTWHHAAGVLRNGLVELYVDGVLVAQDTTNPVRFVRGSTQTILRRIASDFVGGIDEVRIFTRALTAGEIAALVPAPYPIRDLGAPPGDGISWALAINDAGHVAGYSMGSDFGIRVFLWTNGTFQVLPGLGGTETFAYGINAADEVVGYGYTASGPARGILWQNGTPTDLGTLGGTSSAANGINNRGQVVGWSNNATGQEHAFLWDQGNMTDLGTLPGGSFSVASAINAAGQVVGAGDVASGVTHAFLWQSGTMTDLGPGSANGINDAGQVVGTSGQRAVLWENGGMMDLGWGSASSVNHAGQIVGYGAAHGETHGFLWYQGKATDLGTLPNDTYSQAIGINRDGQAVGFSGDQAHAVLWTLPRIAPPPANGLVLSYDMQTLLPDGTMKDLSGRGNHGTLTGTTDVSGKFGRARHFAGGERITAPGISVPAANFTVSAWFSWQTNPSPYYGGIHGGGGSWELRVMADGRFGATFYQSIGPDIFTETRSPLAYNDGPWTRTWHQAAAVLRSGLVELYVDGVLVAKDTTNPITSVRMSTQTIIGRVASDFVGDIDEVQVFTRALSAAEIAAHVSDFLPDRRVDDGGPAGGGVEVSIAATVNGTWYAGWVDYRVDPSGGNYRCAYSGSANGGAWSANELYKGPEAQCADPVVAANAWGGPVYRLATSYTNSGGSPWTSSLMVSRSDDGGHTFGAWHKVVDSQASGGLNDKPWMAVGSNGRVHVVWDLVDGTGVHYARSDDYGETWPAANRMGLGFGGFPCVATDQAGHVYVGWSNNLELRFRKSTDNGATFSPEVSASPDMVGGSGGTPRSFPIPACTVSPDGNHVWFAWSGLKSASNNTHGEDIWVVHSGDGGANWSPKVRVNDDPGNERQIMPWIGVDHEGRLHAAWTDLSGGWVATRYSNSSDNGTSWRTSEQISTSSGGLHLFQGDYQGLTIGVDDSVGVAWTDTRDGITDVWFARTRGVQGNLARIVTSSAFAPIADDRAVAFRATSHDTSVKSWSIVPAWTGTSGSILLPRLFISAATGNQVKLTRYSCVSAASRMEVASWDGGSCRALAARERLVLARDRHGAPMLSF